MSSSSPHLLLPVGFLALLFSIAFATTNPVTLSRSDPIPQRWTWLTGNAKFIEEYAREKNMRVVDISVVSEEPPRFAAVLAENRGEQKLTWFLYTGLNLYQIKKRHRRDRSRLSYLEPYGANTGTTDLLFAAIAVRDRGGANWGYCPSCGPPQQNKYDEYNSISSFFELGRRFWVETFESVSPKKRVRRRPIVVRKKESALREEIKGRRTVIFDIHRHDDGKYSAILERLDKPADSYWLTAVNPKNVTAEAKARSARVYDLEPYVLKGELVFDVLMIEN